MDDLMVVLDDLASCPSGLTMEMPVPTSALKKKRRRKS